jgi:hypothetical protein
MDLKNNILKINNDEIHSKLLAQLIFAVESGDINRAVGIDFKHYNELVKPNESQYYWDLWQNDTNFLRQAITKNFLKILPNSINKKKGRTLIVHHNYSGLAHETQLARNLEFLRKSGVFFELEVAYLFYGNLKQQKAASKLYQIQDNAVYFLQSKSYVDAGNKLNWLTSNKDYTSVIYPSIFQMAFWISLYVSHENQKFLQMKYFPKQVGRIKTWGCGRKNSERIYLNNNEKFIQLSLLNPNLLNVNTNTDTNDNKINQLIQNDLIKFGSISRTEKISDIEYNETILQLLKENIKTQYIFTGRDDKINAIESRVRLHPRAHPLGWVNPNSTIHLFDIYLEPFPWGGGDMTFLALSEARPYLILDTPQNRVVGVYSTLEFLAENGPEILNSSFCNNIDELKMRFSKLVNNKEFRNELGMAWSETMLKYEPNDINEWVNFIIN